MEFEVILSYTVPKTKSAKKVVCTTEEEIAEAFRWMFEKCGRDVEYEVEEWENVKERRAAVSSDQKV